jgi:hypothetical protein
MSVNPNPVELTTDKIIDNTNKTTTDTDGSQGVKNNLTLLPKIF